MRKSRGVMLFQLAPPSLLTQKPAGVSGPQLVVGGRAVAQAGCGGVDMYAKDNWDPKAYFAGRDREWKATVTVGSLEEQGKPADKPAQPNTPSPSAEKPAQQR